MGTMGILESGILDRMDVFGMSLELIVSVLALFAGFIAIGVGWRYGRAANRADEHAKAMLDKANSLLNLMAISQVHEKKAMLSRYVELAKHGSKRTMSQQAYSIKEDIRALKGLVKFVDETQRGELKELVTHLIDATHRRGWKAYASDFKLALSELKL